MESEAQTESQNDAPKLKRYPLWESCLLSMRESGMLHYGSKIDMKWLSEQLGAEPNTIEFGAAISAINDQILQDGYYISSRDQGGLFYLVVHPERAEKVADNYVSDSFRSLRRAINLYGGLQQNPTANIDADFRRRLASKQEKNAMRLILMRKTKAVSDAIKTHAPKLVTNP